MFGWLVVHTVTMFKRPNVEQLAKPSEFGHTDSLTRSERITLFTFVGVATAVDVISLITNPNAHLITGLVSVAMTLTLALYAWSPTVATLVLGSVVSYSFAVGGAVEATLGGALAALLVLRLGTTPLIFMYVGGLLLSGAAISSGLGLRSGGDTSVTGLLVVATLAGLVGYALRVAAARGQRLELRLEEQKEREHEAVLAERRWIAGELHDSIAHHLTVVTLHSQLLDDERTREESADVIRLSARKALNDLRFVIALADEITDTEGISSGDLDSAIEEARAELHATGRKTVLTGDPGNPVIPRGTEIIFARIVRESTTNILKYSGSGEVMFEVEVDDQVVEMTISNPLPPTPRRDLPSTGTGLNRMAQRVLGVEGEFSAGIVGSNWVVRASLPIAPSKS